MAQFKVKIKNIEALTSEFYNCDRELNGLATDIDRVCSSLAIASSATPALKKALRDVSANVRNQARKVSQLENGLSASMTQYKATESRLGNDSQNVTNILKGTGGPAKVKNTGWEFLTQEYTRNWDKFQWEQCLARYVGDDGATAHILKLASSLGVKINSENKKEHKRDNEKTALWSEKHKTAYDENGKEISADSAGLYKKGHTIAEVGVEEKVEVTAYEVGKEFKHGSVNAKFGTAEAHASVKAGLYTYDKNNNVIFAPAIAAEAGASVCVATASAKGKLGDDYYNVSGEGSVSVGKAEAKAKATISLIGENGEINPQINARASAEAIAAEAKGSVGLTVAGAEASVKGSVNFGVGAHADVGYRDGKVVFDIGASLGVGASLGFEVDATGLIKGVCSETRSLIDSSGKLYKGVLKLIHGRNVPLNMV